VEEVFRGLNIGLRDQRSRRLNINRTSIRASEEREERIEVEEINRGSSQQVLTKRIVRFHGLG